MDSLSKRLRDAGRRSAKAAKDRAVAARELESAVVAAVEAGMNKTEIAKAAGINRVTVYRILQSAQKR